MQNNNKALVSALALAMFALVLVVPMSASAKGGQYILRYVEKPPVQKAPTAVTQGTTVIKVASVDTGPATTLNNTNNAGSVAGVSDSNFNGNNNNNGNNSNLSANASNSGYSFMPDTLLEWMFLFIMIFIGVKLYRKVTITEAEKNAPLKKA